MSKRGKYVSSDNPVNRRTAPMAQRQAPAAAHPAVQQRLHAVKAKALLGPPLAREVNHRRPGAGFAVQAVWGVGLAAAAGGGFLAVLQASWSGGLLALGLGAVSVAFGLRIQRTSAAASASAPLIDAAHLRALDAVLDTLANQLPERALPLLVDIKQHIAALAGQPRHADDVFTMEDVLYVNECVRRYLPDTLQAYLQVPAGQRAVANGGDSADDMLLAQLALLRDALAQRRSRLAARAAQSLASQQRFLRAKSKP